MIIHIAISLGCMTENDCTNSNEVCDTGVTPGVCKCGTEDTCVGTNNPTCDNAVNLCRCGVSNGPNRGPICPIGTTCNEVAETCT